MSDAQLCIQACINAYRGAWGDVRPIFQAEDFTDQAPVQYLWGTNPGQRVLAFQGSMDVQDWLDNAKFRRSEDVHRGFKHQYDLIRESVEQRVADLSHSVPLTITGHSLGGALALLAARHLANSGFRHLQVMTFGCPRVGDALFVQMYDRDDIDTMHYVHANDIVPTLPPRRLGYADLPGQVVPIGSVPFWGRWFPSIRAHDPRKYREALGDPGLAG